MRVSSECVACCARQIVEVAEMATPDPVLREQVIRDGLRRLAGIPYDRTPAHIGMVIHRGMRQLLGSVDPYRDLKERTNRAALDLYPRLSQMVETSPGDLELPVRLAIAGNTIDFGYLAVRGRLDLEAEIEDALHRPLAINHLAQLRQAIDSSGSILYLADNAGEIVLDRILIEAIPDYRARVTVAVRGTQVINDATLDDARQAGLVGQVRVIENGSDAPGTILETCDELFRQAFAQADMVIAKGQGNYESLSESGRSCFFLLKAKCDLVARDLQVARGDIVVKAGDGQGR